VVEIRTTLDLVEAFKVSAIAPEELAEAQTRWIKEFDDTLTSADGICKSIMDSELFRLGTNYAAAFPDFVHRAGADMVKEAAKEWVFPGGVVILVRGPSAVLKADLETLGTVRPIAP
jgi:hypothetical protein